MTTVLLSGWNAGFNKVRFTRLVQDLLGYSLTEAKRVTDQIMDGETVTVEVPETQADHVIASISELGARCAVAAPIH